VRRAGGEPNAAALQRQPAPVLRYGEVRRNHAFVFSGSARGHMYSSLRGGGMFKWLVRFAIAKKVYDVVQERRRKRR
jgi:hypothetical protein